LPAEDPLFVGRQVDAADARRDLEMVAPQGEQEMLAVGQAHGRAVRAVEDRRVELGDLLRLSAGERQAHDRGVCRRGVEDRAVGAPVATAPEGARLGQHLHLAGRQVVAAERLVAAAEEADRLRVGRPERQDAGLGADERFGLEAVEPAQPEPVAAERIGGAEDDRGAVGGQRHRRIVEEQIAAWHRQLDGARNLGGAGRRPAASAQQHERAEPRDEHPLQQSEPAPSRPLRNGRRLGG
jgi:hypothetical protein